VEKEQFVQALKRFKGIVYLLVALSAMIVPVSHVVQASPARLQSDEQSGESGVAGTSYTSPHFGYSITWDRAWSVTDESNEADTDSLTLTNNISIVSLNGIPFQADLPACIDGFAQPFRTDDTVSEFDQRKTADGPVGGEDDDRVWSVFEFTYTGENSDPVDFTMYVDCRWIVEGESALIISSLANADTYDSQVEPLEELLAGLSIEGSTGTAPDDDDTEDSGPADSGDTSDLGRFVQLSADDVDTFWTREFPLVSGGQEYTPPADVIAFDTDLDTDCGEIAVMEVGPAYCALDKTIYYDLAFAQIQVDNFGSTSVIAVVMAHETGHHVQNLMQWKKCAQSPCLDPTEMTSQEFELQADCFAGAWMADAETRGRLGNFDIEANIAQFALILGDEGIGNSADPGVHGKAARRTYEFLNGYYNGVTECLTISAASDPARNGGANANAEDAGQREPAADATEESNGSEDDPTVTADDPTPTEGNDQTGLIQVGEEYGIELRDSTLSITVTDAQAVSELPSNLEPDGKYLVVLFTLQREAEAAGPFPYESFVLVDGDGNEYEFNEVATDAILKTAETLPDGVDQAIEDGLTYRLAIAFDVPEDASGFTFSTSSGEFPVELDI
jgi:predicted metalloprotease